MLSSSKAASGFIVDLSKSNTTFENDTSRFTINSSIGFKDYDKGIVKSLGAWGGDFIMVTAKHKEALTYFREKGFDISFSFEDIIL